ncbi:MAG: phosphatidylglycerophosphatase A [Phycisphaeraceae bacterium]|nr:phosphatidylglycerophosphatase A [Phycisphaeraceae bacterium]
MRRQRGLVLASTFGLGYMRPAPGTWGSLPPVILALVLTQAGLGPLESPWAYHGVLVAVLIFFSLATVISGDLAEAVAGRKDPSLVVADETAGQCLPLMALPLVPLTYSWRAAFWTLAWLAGAFVAFRLMDILKPPPAAQLQRVRGGWGILIDDLVAGLLALAIMQASIAIFA